MKTLLLVRHTWERSQVVRFDAISDHVVKGSPSYQIHVWLYLSLIRYLHSDNVVVQGSFASDLPVPVIVIYTLGVAGVMPGRDTGHDMVKGEAK